MTIRIGKASETLQVGHNKLLNNKLRKIYRLENGKKYIRISTMYR